MGLVAAGALTGACSATEVNLKPHSWQNLWFKSFNSTPQLEQKVGIFFTLAKIYNFNQIKTT